MPFMYVWVYFHQTIAHGEEIIASPTGQKHEIHYLVSITLNTATNTNYILTPTTPATTGSTKAFDSIILYNVFNGQEERISERNIGILSHSTIKQVGYLVISQRLLCMTSSSNEGYNI